MMNHLDPNQGLHLLKKQIKQDYATEQAEFIRQNLEKLIVSTERAAPRRQLGRKKADLYRLWSRNLDEEKRLLPTRGGHSEAYLERAAWCRWYEAGGRVLGSWERLVTFQMPLNNSLADEGWGKVDILGLSPDGLPVVVELKRAKSKDSLLAVMVQALAYGIALRVNWDQFRQHWQKALTRMGEPREVPESLGDCPLVCAAPEKYWQRALAERRGEMWIDPDMRQKLRNLAVEFGKHRYPVSFVSLDVGDGEQPLIHGARLIEL